MLMGFLRIALIKYQTYWQEGDFIHDQKRVGLGEVTTSRWQPGTIGQELYFSIMISYMSSSVLLSLNF